jgi:hypothetical protein
MLTLSIILFSIVSLILPKKEVATDLHKTSTNISVP